MTSVLNLGCPVRCEGMTCVDLYPITEGVMKAEACEYLSAHPEEYEEIRTTNLLEHLPNVRSFLELAFKALKPQGTIRVVTDNAEWLPFYLPLSIPHTGIGAHAKESYALHFNTVHYSIFSKMHLKVLLMDSGFKAVAVKRDWRTLGARLIGTGTK